MQKNIIIETLLDIIDKYDNNKIAKNRTIAIYQEDNYIIVITLTTKGNANKNTPFYFGNMYTFIIKEYWHENSIFNAEILYSTK